MNQVCELPTVRLVPVVRPFFAFCDSKTGHALLTNSRVTAGQARRAYHLRVFVNAGENSQDLSKYCTAAKNYYFLQVRVYIQRVDLRTCNYERMMREVRSWAVQTIGRCIQLY